MGRSTPASLRLMVRYCLLAAAGLCLANLSAATPQASDSLSGHVEGIKPFPPDHDSGSMAVYAMKSAIGQDFPRATYGYLVGVTCAAFKFVYDSVEVYEPLRDACPVDVLTVGADALGYHEAHWELGLPIEDVKELIRKEIGSGRPVITPYLKPDAYHGFCIVTGYDLEQDVFHLQGAFGPEEVNVTVPVPESWDGPTMSPAGWATNPVFVLGPKADEYQNSAGIAKRVFAEAIRLMQGGTITYGNHPGEAEYMRQAGPHEALYGLPALDLLSADVEHEPLVVDVDGTQAVNFGFIWRIDAQVGQLEHDRLGAAHFIRALSNSVPAERLREVRGVLGAFESISADARELRRAFWHVIPDSLTGYADVSLFMAEAPSLVFRLAADEGLHDDLRADGYGVFRTPWGWVAIDDSHEKRMLAKTVLRRIVVREGHQIERLNLMMEYIGRPMASEAAKKRREKADK